MKVFLFFIRVYSFAKVKVLLNNKECLFLSKVSSVRNDNNLLFVLSKIVFVRNMFGGIFDIIMC